MRLNVLPEPELVFGGEGRHVDVRFGLMNHGPVDIGEPRLRRIAVGIIGTGETIAGLRGFIERIDRGIAAKESETPNLFPRFPGYSQEGYRCSFDFNSRWERQISMRALRGAVAGPDGEPVAQRIANLLLEELKHLAESSPSPDVTLIALPAEVSAMIDEAAPAQVDEESDEAAAVVGGEAPVAGPALHDLLKAGAMRERQVIQVVWPPTWDPSQAKSMKSNPTRQRALQDDATRAWNLVTALYYKAGGTPWRLIRRRSDLASLHVGVSFYKSLDGKQVHTSLAQVFDERGDGTIVRGGVAKFHKDDRIPHLDAADARTLLSTALRSYRKVHHNFPARVVMHKSSRYNEAECEGFRAAAAEERIDLLDLVSIGNPKARLFRDGYFPPLRGSLLTLGRRELVLYTRGSVDFFQSYPGMYIPRPLGIRCEDVEGTPQAIAEEILALSKMNWNTTQFDGREPITLYAAEGAARVIRCMPATADVEAQYRFYM